MSGARHCQGGPADGAPVPPGRDAGVASVVVLALSSVVVLVGMVLVALAGVAVARHRAAAAADLGALAAAQHSLEGQAQACARAGRLLEAQGARLVSCAVNSEASLVEAEVRPAGVLGGLGAARERARAGPAQQGVP